MKNLYASCSANKQKALNFVKNMRAEADCEFFTFSVTKNGKTLVKCAPPPYDTSDAAQVYSLSKSFCSTAAGFAFDDGLWKPSDRLVDIFPESTPEIVSENLSLATMGDVLSMSCGHENCAMSLCITSDDPIRAFMEKEFKFKPGTHFAYNTGATFVVAAMVEKLTGKSLLDYLDEKLFRHLGVHPEKWQRTTNKSYCTVPGICEGGVGIYVSLDCIIAFGEFIRNGGKVGEKQLLSHEWLSLATSGISDNSANGTRDWCAGYGYQFWMNADGGFRGDGAFGQLCVIYPKQAITACCRAKTGNMQKELDFLSSFAFSLDAESTDGEGYYEDEILEKAFAPEKPVINGEFSAIGKIFKLNKNHQNFTTLRFEKNPDGGITALFSDGENYIPLIASPEKHTLSSFHATAFKPTLLGLIPERCEEVSLWSSLGEMSSDHLKINVRFKNAPHKGSLFFSLSPNGKIKIFLSFEISSWSNENPLSTITGNL